MRLVYLPPMGRWRDEIEMTSYATNYTQILPTEHVKDYIHLAIQSNFCLSKIVMKYIYDDYDTIT